MFESTLKEMTAIIYHSRLSKVIADAQNTHLGNIVLLDKPSGHIPSQRTGIPTPKEEEKLYKIYFTLGSKYGPYDREKKSPTPITTPIIPTPPLIWLARLLSYLKASLITTWFTEYALPIFYAIGATAAIIIKWWELNHLMKYALKNAFNQTLISL